MNNSVLEYLLSTAESLNRGLMVIDDARADNTWIYILDEWMSNA